MDTGNILQRITFILDDIRHYKGRQWEVTSCALLLMAACFGVSESIKHPSIAHAVTLLAFVGIINAMGIVLLYKMYSDVLNCRLWLLKTVDKLPEGDDRKIWNRDEIAKSRGGDVTWHLASVVFAAASLLTWTMCSSVLDLAPWVRGVFFAFECLAIVFILIAVLYKKPRRYRIEVQAYLTNTTN